MSEIEKVAQSNYAGVAERLNALLDRFADRFEFGDKGGRGAALERLTGQSKSSWALWLSDKQLPPLKSLDVAIQRIAEEVGYPHKTKHILAWVLFGSEIVPDPIVGTGTNPVDHYHRCRLDNATNEAMASLRLAFSDFTRDQINNIYDKIISTFLTGHFDPESKDTKLQIVKIIADELVGKKV